MLHCAADKCIESRLVLLEVFRPCLPSHTEADMQRKESTRLMKCSYVPLNATDNQVENLNGDVILIGTEAPGRHVIRACDVE